MLWKYTLDLAHIVDWGGIIVDTDGTFKEGPVHIMDIQDQVLQRKSEGVVATPRSRGSNIGTRGHDASHLSFPI